MSQGIENEVVVITGASGGLGEATARRLAKDGAKLILGARRVDRLRALAGELKLDDDAMVQTDVTDREQVKRLVDRAVEKHGRIDVILDNAGLMPSYRTGIKGERMVETRNSDLQKAAAKEAVGARFTGLPIKVIASDQQR